MGDSTVHVCPECKSLPISEQDAYCGLCGRQIGRLHVELEMDSLEPETACPISARLINPTCGNFHIDSISFLEYPADEARPCKWAQVEGVSARDLGPGSDLKFEVMCDTYGVESGAAQLRVSGDVKSSKQDGVIVVCPEPPPPIVFEPSALETWPGGPAAFNVKIFPETGVMRLRRISNAAGSWLKIDLQPNTSGSGWLFSKSHPLEAELQLNKERYNGIAANQLIRERVEMRATYAGLFDKDVVADIGLQSRHSPDFRYDDSPKRKLFSKTDRCEITLKFQNGDPGKPGQNCGPFRITGISAVTGAAWTIDFADERLFPISLLGGQRKEVKALLDLKLLKSGDYELQFRVDTDLRSEERYIIVPIRVIDLQKFLGKLVIDFGTTNSCAALVKEGTFLPDLRMIDPSEPYTTSATALMYGSLKSQPPKITTGNEPARAYRKEVVRSLKQRLGNPSVELADTDQVYSVDAKLPAYRPVWRQVADYLRELRRRLENTDYFADIVLTHPAICSLTHFRNMKKALAEAFPEGQTIRFLQEPIAALAPFMYEKGVEFEAGGPDSRNEYSVAAFDMGGGTTDVTVVMVQHKKVGQITFIEPVILKSWGEKFGGEDLSEYIRQQVRQRCDVLLKDRKATLIYGTEEDNQDSAEGNQNAIARWAESWKLAFTANDFAKFLALDLAVVAEHGEKLEILSLEEVQACLIEGVTLPDAYRDHLTRKITELVERLLQSQIGSKLDFIQLSGKSSQIPDVQQAVAAHLRAAGSLAKVVRADELRSIIRADMKECVVYGAAIWYGSGAGTVAFKKQGADQRTTSRIGRSLPGGFQAFIELDQVIDPKEGLWSEYREIPWQSGSGAVIAIYENLSEKNAAVIGGKKNQDITLSMQFEPKPIDVRPLTDWAESHPGMLVDLQLHLTPQLDLEAFVKLPTGTRYQLLPLSNGREDL